ncbi:MAG: LysE family transporter [Deltaproteobacteria bacterium]|nr:LysE family transporter [Deltaproteobacteria bacterium]
MNLLTLTITSFVVAFSGALMPGPLLAITVDHSLKKGAIAGPLIIVGHGILEITLITAIVLGMGDFLQKRIVFTISSLCGGAILLWMGQDMIRKAKNTTTTPKKGIFTDSSIIAGILGSLSNPYWTIWWVTIGLTYLILAMPYGILGISLFFTGHILADLSWYSIVSLGVSKGKRYIGLKTYQILTSFCGIFLVFFGGYLLLDAVI